LGLLLVECNPQRGLLLAFLGVELVPIKQRASRKGKEKRKRKQKKKRSKKEKEKQKKQKAKKKDFWLLVMRCFRACGVSVWMLVV
jgi:hypothetical protein